MGISIYCIGKHDQKIITMDDDWTPNMTYSNAALVFSFLGIPEIVGHDEFDVVYGAVSLDAFVEVVETKLKMVVETMLGNPLTDSFEVTVDGKVCKIDSEYLLRKLQFISLYLDSVPRGIDTVYWA